jgi:hypothetical protein
MSAEIEGEVRELDEERAIVVRQPDRLAQAPTPEDTLSLATRMATALKDVVEKQKLFAVIQGKKYPQVEAWMTIARMDNVVAREARPPIRRDDGSYEAFVELIRLSDGMVVGAGSALCGTPDDRPWATRGEPARRSMAVTRATSRAFRQQYSWIMALAGYEPTPAEEMPRDDGPAPASTPEPERTHDGGLIGTVELGKGDADFELAPDAGRLGDRVPARVGPQVDQGDRPPAVRRTSGRREGRPPRQDGDRVGSDLRRDVPTEGRDEGRDLPGAHARPDQDVRARPDGTRTSR